MSRLDSFIRRLEAQRACLDWAAGLVRMLPGPVFELGLGNGRTYDHLRQLCPEREIYVFDRQVAAHPDCIPDPAYLVLGEIRETLPRAAERFARQVPLIHSDVGSGDAESNRRLAAFLAGELPHLLRPGGIVIADQDVAFPGAVPLDLPAGVRSGRYFVYRMP